MLDTRCPVCFGKTFVCGPAVQTPHMPSSLAFGSSVALRSRAAVQSELLRPVCDGMIPGADRILQKLKSWHCAAASALVADLCDSSTVACTVPSLCGGCDVLTFTIGNSLQVFLLDDVTQ